ncbi:8-amino-7-oxononanoate synthase [Picochlorum sp. SENEW3]|nr:8-amino-7-oxononanoate synthase [Picochlorum sp. SENEW3]
MAHNHSYDDYHSWVTARLEELNARHLRRHLNNIVQPYCQADNRSFNSNDYLGLSSHPAVRQAMAKVAMQYGNGPRSSALVAGYTQYHRDLETQISQLKETEEAVLFSSGFAANVGLLSSLLSEGNIDVFSDELNHASIIDGIRLGKAYNKSCSVHVYRHNDMAHLDELLLSRCRRNRRRLVVTDSLFSMDGDFARLPDIVRLKKKHGFLLIIDEAHATLVCGEHGGGAAEMFGVQKHVDLHVGTLSKAVGSQGGFVACSASMKNFLVNKGRTLVFSTSLPIPCVASAQMGIVIGQREPWRRRHLEQLTRRIQQQIGSGAASPIIPIVIGPEQQTLEIADTMQKDYGFIIPAIRPPTVPSGTSRLRISLSATHKTSTVDELIEALIEATRPRRGKL